MTSEPDKTSAHTRDAGEDHAQNSRSNTQGSTAHARQEVSSNNAGTTKDGATTEDASTNTYTRDTTRDNTRDYTSDSQQNRGTPNRNRSDIGNNRNTPRNDVVSSGETSTGQQSVNQLSLLSSSSTVESNVTLNSTLNGTDDGPDNNTEGTSSSIMAGNTGRKLFTVTDPGFLIRRERPVRNLVFGQLFIQKYYKKEKLLGEGGVARECGHTSGPCTLSDSESEFEAIL